MKRAMLIPMLLLAATLSPVYADTTWPPAGGPPMTQWAKDVSPSNALPEYPRPQLTRERWQNLNGLWDYAIVDRDVTAGIQYAGQILVPYPPQSVLSRVDKPIDPQSRIWYHRTFQVPAGWAGQHVILHFGAVDWEAHVLVNGKEVGIHKGGYDGFSFDITDALTGAGLQQLVVAAWNPIQGGQPHGKQALKPSGIFYTPTTGIWQTVWMEPVPASHIRSLRMAPNVDKSRLELGVEVTNSRPGQTVEAVVMVGGKAVARKSGAPGAPLSISISHPRLWWPESPFLYGLTVTLRDHRKSVDTVGSYFGMRKISVGPDEKGVTHILLNNKFIFQNGLLDQGFWPDGVYTAPTDAALRSDLEVARKLGFNMIRKHMKVEPDRWYYWADKLGVLVWQDMPASIEMDWGPRKEFIPDREGEFEEELRRMVQGRFNHPSIIVWVVFNEGWGLGTAPRKPGDTHDEISDASKAREKRMVDAVRQEDSTRLIDPESGAGGGGNQGANLWDIGLGDIIDYHCYGGDGPHPEKHRAGVIGETGWGVAPAASLEGRLKTAPELGLSAIVFTQLTDVENERNGALNYDRSPKAGVPIEATGQQIVSMLHAAGYTNYPGGPE